MLKKTALLLLLTANTSFAAQLYNYQDAVEAINNGQSIKFVIDWDLCKNNTPNIKPNFSSSYKPDNVDIAKEGYIKSWGMVYTRSISLLPQISSVNQAYVYTFTKNNELHAINYFLDPITYKEKFPAVEATCQLGNGFKIFSYS